MLFRKMFRDLIANKTQFIAIFLMAFMAVYVFVGLDCEVNGCRRGISRYYAETNLFDLKVMGAAFTDEDILKLKKLDGVLDAEQKATIKGFVELDQEFNAELNFINSNQISCMKYVDGNPYSPGAPGVWLDYRFVERQGLSIGDPIDIKIGSRKFTEILQGSFMNPEYVYYLPDEAAMMPDYGAYAFGFLDASRYPGEDFYFTQILVDLEGVDNLDNISDSEKRCLEQMKTRIDEVLNYDNLAMTNKGQSVSYATYDMELTQHETMAFIFPIVFMLISVLGIVTTMTRMTANQRTQIGTLKALGFSRKAITFHFVTYGAVLSFSGAVLGGISGYYSIAGLLLDEMKTVYLNPYMERVVSARALVVIFFAVAVSAYVSYSACKNVLKDNAATILRPAVPKNVKASAIERSKFWLSLNFSTQWNVRDILRNKMRSIMGVIGVSGCTMLMIAAFGCLDTMDFIMDWMYGQLITGNYKIIFEQDATYGFVYDINRKYDGQMVQESAVELSFGDISKTGTVLVLDEGHYYNFQDKDQNFMELPENGIGISFKMAELLGVIVGDEISWNIVGDKDTYSCRVAAVYRTPTSQGIAMRREVFEKFGEKFKPGYVYTNKTVPKNIDENPHIVGRQNLSEMMENLMSMMDLMYLMVGILIFAAVVLGVVVLYNMGVLSFVEKTREICTLKVLGFQSKTIRGILQKQNIWITSVGIILGLLFGRAMLVAMFSDMGDSMDYMAIIFPLSYVYAIIGTFLVSILVNWMLSKKVETIDMVDALKGVE